MSMLQTNFINMGALSSKTLVLALALGVMFVGCKDEDDSPAVITLEPIVVNNTTVQLKAHFKTAPLTGEQYGFVWDGLKGPDFTKHILAFTTPPSSNDIIAELGGLDMGKEYFVRAFLKRGSSIDYGDEKSFVFGGLVPEVLKIAPDNAHWGDTIKIVGKNFSLDPRDIVCQFGQLISKVIYTSADTLECIVPFALASGTHLVKVKVGSSLSSGISFTLLNPEVSDISPSSATYLELVTIKGTNFHYKPSSNIVRFGSVPADVVSVSRESLTVKVPVDLNASTSVVSVQVDSQRVNASNSFTLLPSTITKVEPNVDRVGNIITIAGTNFNPSAIRNEVRFGNNKASVVEATSTELKVQVPNGIYDDRSVPLTVRVSDVTHNLTFTLKNAWIRKADIPAGMFGRYGGQGFASGGVAYAGLGLGSGVSSPYQDFYKFDEQTNSWEKIADYGGGKRYWSASFVINDIAYVGTGSKLTSGEGTNDFYKYDPQTDHWTRIADFPGTPATRAVGFSANGKGYVCLQTPDNNFWEYDPTLDVWTQKTTLITTPWGGIKKAVGAFVLDGRAFVIATLNSNSEFYEYDLTNDLWIRKNDLSGMSSHLPAVVATNAHAYYLSGSAALRYNISSDSWDTIDFDPVPSRIDAFFMTVGDKIFLGGGRENNYQDVWECDTTKL